MSKKHHPLFYLFLGGVFLFLDQYLKFLARSNPEFRVYFSDYKWLGWELFQNAGIAFSIGVPNWILIIVTPLIIIIFVALFLKKENYFTILSLLLGGALSNFIDRVLFGYTIDYFRVYISVINLADVLIVSAIINLAIKQFNSTETEPVFN